MPAPFTPAQEARLREIVREELAVGRRLEALRDDRVAIVHHPLAGGQPIKLKGVARNRVRRGPGLSFDEFAAGRRVEASPQAPGQADELP